MISPKALRSFRERLWQWWTRGGHWGELEESWQGPPGAVEVGEERGMGRGHRRMGRS